MDDVWSGLVGAVLGGLLALVGSYLATNMQIKEARKITQETRRTIVNAYIESVCDELELLWLHYSEDMGREVRKVSPGEMLEYSYPIHEDYFTVYNSNTNIVGEIRSKELRRLIIETYMNCKSIVDSFRINNQMLDSLEKIEPHGDSHAIAAQKQQLILYAEGLKELDAIVGENIGRLLLIAKAYLKENA